MQKGFLDVEWHQARFMMPLFISHLAEDTTFRFQKPQTKVQADDYSDLEVAGGGMKARHISVDLTADEKQVWIGDVDQGSATRGPWSPEACQLSPCEPQSHHIGIFHKYATARDVIELW